MEKDHFLPKEVIQTVGIGVGLLALSLCAFSREQRDWIKQRDGYRCQCPECTGHKGYLNVHHIVPKSLCEAQGIEPDTPMNGITICEGHHGTIHETGNKAFETEKGMVIWGSQWLGELSSRAVENTRLAFVQGRIFPRKYGG